MKKSILLIWAIILIAASVNAQRSGSSEKYGNTLNLGLGIGYYGYVNDNVPVVHLNYEFDVAKDFTLAPFITLYSYQHKEYRQTVIPIGMKGSYYFDQILAADAKWDFYLAGSLGFVVRNTRWNDGNDRKFEYRDGAGRVYLDLHIGTEYHFNNKIGAFLDLSTGVSTIGISIH